jgi:hypothetical protein
MAAVGADDRKLRREQASERPANDTTLPSELAPERAVGTRDHPCHASPHNGSRRAQREPRTIPAEVRRTVSERDGGRCTFVDPRTGRRCDERRFLEFDHIEPYALGGSATASNIRLICGVHNALLARRVFGDQYVAAAVAGSKRTTETVG